MPPADGSIADWSSREEGKEGDRGGTDVGVHVLMQRAVLEGHVDEHFHVGNDLGEAEYREAKMARGDGLEQGGRAEVERGEGHAGWLPSEEPAQGFQGEAEGDEGEEEDDGNQAS